MHSLFCWYCMRLGRFYYVIWTFHVLSLYIMFLSHLLFLCVAVYLSPLLSSLTISSLFFFSNCNFNYERERERSKYMSNDLVPSNRVSSSFAHTHTPHQHGEPRGVRYTQKHVKQHKSYKSTTTPHFLITISKTDLYNITREPSHF